MIGTWIQNVGAQWRLIHQPGAETLVALGTAAAVVPVLVLAMPAAVRSPTSSTGVDSGHGTLPMGGQLI